MAGPPFSVLGQSSRLPTVDLLPTSQRAVAIAPFSRVGGLKPFKRSVTVILGDYQVGVYLFIPLLLLGIYVFSVEDL